MPPSFIFIKRRLASLGGLFRFGHVSTLHEVTVELNYRKQNSRKASTTSRQAKFTGNRRLCLSYKCAAGPTKYRVSSQKA